MHEIIEGFLNGKKIRDKNWILSTDYIVIDSDKNIINNSGNKKNIFWELIMRFPENYKLYEEPKKTWIYSNEFYKLTSVLAYQKNMEHPLGMCLYLAGAVVLAKEIKNRLSSNDKQSSPYYSFHEINEFLKDLVGERNL